jgi:hypothetical protein
MSLFPGSSDHLPCKPPYYPSQLPNLYNSALKMEAAYFYETSVSAYEVAGCHNPEDH